MPTLGQRVFVLEPQYRERVWGGQRLKAADPPIGEAWIAYGPSAVSAGPRAGQTLDQLIEANGPELLGKSAYGRYGRRFPLLIKLLDCHDWLSVQVHPNDEQARRMVGPEEFGKTEAWYFLEAEPSAQILAGVKPGVQPAELAAAIRSGRILDVATRVDVRGGDALLIPAGTLHAIGPGLLLYEIQQASDTTYRAYDWERPMSAGRKLHIEESVEVTLPAPALDRTRPHVGDERGVAAAVECAYFELDLVRVSQRGAPLEGDTRDSFHILTVVDGTAEIQAGGEAVPLGRFQTALVAGSAGAYDIRVTDEPATLLRARLPE
jgi:mannose-6-phosphate isomerase